MLIASFTRAFEKLATKHDFLFWLMRRYYEKLVKRESLLADIGQGDRVLCVGGGPCPITAILLNSFTKARVDVIDNDKQCVQCADAFLQDKGLTHIRVFHSDARIFSYEDYDVIHLALQVSPVEESMQKILTEMNKTSKLLVRCPKERLKYLYDRGNRTDDRLQIDRVEHGLFSNTGHTCLLQKEVRLQKEEMFIEKTKKIRAQIA